MDSNLWARRTNSTKLSLATTNSSTNGDRSSSLSKRFGGDSSSQGGRNPLNTATTPGSGLASPGGGANFGLGTGAFSSFGALTTKTPKTPGNPFDGFKGASDKAGKDTNGRTPKATGGAGDNNNNNAQPGGAGASGKGGKAVADQPSETPLYTAWCFWFRPAIPKNVSIPYDETVHGLAEVATVEQFWTVYRHLVRPSALHPVSDYHLFKKGVRPIWEDEENRSGGKWLVRLKKGVADRYWEDLMLALIGNQFNEAGVEICGAVVSVRNGEDIISIWIAKETKMTKIRDTFKKVLHLPANTKIEWKVHEDSLQQRMAMEESRKEKANQHRGKSQNQRQHQVNNEAINQS